MKSACSWHSQVPRRSPEVSYDIHQRTGLVAAILAVLVGLAAGPEWGMARTSEEDTEMACRDGLARVLTAP